MRLNMPLPLLILPLAFCLAGCGTAIDQLSSLPQAVANALFGKDEAEEVKTYMKTWYWWRDQTNLDKDVSTAKDAEEALEILRYKEKDRFSYIENYSSYNAFFREGKTIAFGISYRDDADKVTIRSISPGSPAEVAGLKRGDAITAIDGTSVKTLTTESRLSEAFGPSEVGITRSFSVARGALSQGQATELKIVKGAFSVRPVTTFSLQTSPNGTKVGYLHLTSFIDQTIEQWRAALTELKNQGAANLIVDLRYNGGGSLVSSQQLASSLAPASAEGKTFAKVRHNKYNARSDMSYDFVPEDRILAAARIAFLVDKGTCSASEALIQGLKPHTSIAIIGNTTCGKPVGFTPQFIANQTKVLSAVDFALSNSTGETDYFDGLVPTCKVDDDLTKALGDPSEAKNAAALYWLDSGTCPVGTLPGKSIAIGASDLGASSRQTTPFARSTLEWFSLR